MTKVVHCKKESFDIYIGRPSKWENPYPITETDTREVVIQLYREWLHKSGLVNDIEELRGKTLGCWCSPKKCHGDVLVELLEEQ